MKNPRGEFKIPAVSTPLLDREFFARDTLTVARELIGATLVIGPCAGRIVETEAYTDDAASHAVMRRETGGRLMRETYGCVYIHMHYGIHLLLNITTERRGVGAVLLRAVEPIAGIETMIERRGTTALRELASGPGRLGQAFAISLDMNGEPLGKRVRVYARAGEPPISTSPRIGISRATDLEWRFFETGSPFVSRAQPLKRRPT